MRLGKETLLQEVKNRVQSSPYIILTNYKGMTVPELSELRKRLRPSGAKFTVVKNTLLRLAARDSGLPEFTAMLEGQVAIVAGSQDVCAAAKIIKNFNSEFSKPLIKGGVLDGAVLTSEQVIALADLPSREALLAQILGLLNAPASKLVRLLNTPGEMLARALQEKSNKNG
jgi:large subunit ribosomal protein L10